ncbi:unnamed protein product [Brassica rapa]|uniref:DYW domain-containing protein n=1 Tax=Brassica campestris TaxID=3711 RepID=A0A8D9M9M0_BRACM|nr:unnamed protein product [Brassica rapa]
MPVEPSVDVWETLMNFSRVHGDVELGDRCAELVEKLDATSTREWRNERVEKENKQEWTFGYKEEVAVVRKLIDSRPRSSVTVLSNFRICPNCHDALKLMSEITGRQLIKRDSKKFHIFGKGLCSCNDRW